MYSRSGSANGPVPAPGSISGNGKDEKLLPRSKTKQIKQPPFARTRADERKLKIVLIPATAAEMALEGSDEATYHSAYHHAHDGRDVKGKGKDKEKANWNGNWNGNGNGKGKAIANPTAIGSKEEAGKSKWRELDEIVRSETVVYPGWDRYIIRRMD
jgi:hypothetical protein